MNEQLVVKNFGPIDNATVDFKRVTVFIGPTGGGKSTLAKLAAVLKQSDIIQNGRINIDGLFRKYSLENFASENTYYSWRNSAGHEFLFDKQDQEVTHEISKKQIATIVDVITKDNKYEFEEMLDKSLNESVKVLDEYGFTVDEINKFFNEAKEQTIKNFAIKILRDQVFPNKANYFPSERVFIASLQYSWAGLLRDDIGLPKNILDFANKFSTSRKEITELNIAFLNAKYVHLDGQDFIQVPGVEKLFRLYETASGIQSVTPLLVLLEHLSRNTEQAQSFIIEEPELNLYPTAQRDLVYTLLEKCTQGENDLTITTHSPYVLSALNLALYANKVATLFPYQHKKVAKLIPEKYWLKAEEFSAYFVAKGGATSIFDSKTGLLSESQLDEVSGEFADVFDRLTDLRVPEKKAVAKVKPVKK
jgi:predicted ATPase